MFMRKHLFTCNRDCFSHKGDQKNMSFGKLQRRHRRCRDRMVVGFTTTYAISAYHH